MWFVRMGAVSPRGRSDTSSLPTGGLTTGEGVFPYNEKRESTRSTNAGEKKKHVHRDDVKN